MINNIIEDFATLSKKDFTKEWESLTWVLANECGWSEEEILNTEIPFVFSLLEGRSRAFKEQEKMAKRKK